jgi:hypothetical protein
MQRQGRALEVIERENTAMLADRVAIGHARDVIGDLARLLVRIALHLVVAWQQNGIRQKRFEQFAHDAAGFHAHAVDLEMAVQVRVQEAFQRHGLGAHRVREADQRRRGAHVVDGRWRRLGD